MPETRGLESDIPGADVAATSAWASTEGLRALFDHAVAWLRQRKIPLSGVTRLTRLVTTVRARVAERLWRALADRTDDALCQRSWHLLALSQD
ncbi:MAG: hypothetical protein ACLQVK_20965 [Acidimicrobiales bacterium]